MKRWWLLILIIMVILAVPSFNWWRREWREHSQDGPILAAARRYGVEPSLIKAVVWRESWFNPQAFGRAREIGLMQIRKAALQEWLQAERLPLVAEASLFDPRTNTLAGTWYLRKLIRRYAHTDNAVAYALADYNAGRSNVLRWNQGMAATNSAAFRQQIDFPGTQKYVTTVLERFAYYQPRFPAR